MLNKLTSLSMVAVVFFLGRDGAQGQSNSADAAALYGNLSIRQLGVPNPLNEPYYFSSPNAPTQTWHTAAGDVQASVGYLGLFSLTNTDAVMRNLGAILQNTRIESSASSFDPVFGMRYKTSAVAAAINANAGSLAATAISSGTIPGNAAMDMSGVANAVVGAGISKISAGTLELTGPTTGGTLQFTGINMGTLSQTGGGFSGATANARISSSGGVLDLAITNPGIVAQTGGGFSGATVSLTSPVVNTSSFTWGTSGLMINGAGTLTLANPATYSGPTLVTGGTLAVNSPSIQAGNVTLNGCSIVSLSRGNSGIDAGVSVNGSGKLTLSGTNTYSGSTTISGGVLLAATGQIPPVNSALVFNGGVPQSNGTVNLNGGISLTGTSPIQAGTLTLTKSTLSVSRPDNTIDPVLLGSGLTKTGKGLLTLTGGLVYTGGGLTNPDPLFLPPPNNGGALVAIGGILNAPSINPGTLMLGPPALVPEPSACWLLIGAGIGGLLVKKSRRKPSRI
ncbi:MAG: autotransporter-associated beta strand repeat-containing protein [Pirellulales bacterium]|nr:autotransporter-associated beta strand repeat-containing protein [Pirellulales bacterium]